MSVTPFRVDFPDAALADLADALSAEWPGAERWRNDSQSPRLSRSIPGGFDPWLRARTGKAT